MVPLHKMPAANPEPERLADETSVKTSRPKVNNKLDPAVPVRTHTPSRVVPFGPSHAALSNPAVGEGTRLAFPRAFPHRRRRRLLHRLHPAHHQTKRGEQTGRDRRRSPPRVPAAVATGTPGLVPRA